MERVLVWDLPVRLVHGMLVIGVAAAAGLAFLADDDGPLFPYHGLIGLFLMVPVAFRVGWMLVGTRHARLGAMAFGPGAVLEYLGRALRGGADRSPGHNPASAWAGLAMLALLAGLGLTGRELGRGNEGVEDLHQALAYGLLAVVGAHLAGLALHTFHHRDGIGRSMVDGRKPFGSEGAIDSVRPGAAALLVGLALAWGLGLVRGFDPARGTARVPILGETWTLGEVEHEERGRHRDDD